MRFFKPITILFVIVPVPPERGGLNQRLSIYPLIFSNTVFPFPENIKPASGHFLDRELMFIAIVDILDDVKNLVCRRIGILYTHYLPELVLRKVLVLQMIFLYIGFHLLLDSESRSKYLPVYHIVSPPFLRAIVNPHVRQACQLAGYDRV